MGRAARDTLDGILVWAKNSLFKPHLAKKLQKTQFFGPRSHKNKKSKTLLVPTIAKCFSALDDMVFWVYYAHTWA